MKKVILYVALLASVVACKKAKELLDITFRHSVKSDFTLPKTADQVVAVPDSLISIRTPDIKNTIPDEFSKNNADINKVKSVTIENIDLTIKSPTAQTFGFLKTVSIYLGAPGKKDTLIATKTDINKISPEPTTLSLDPQNTNLMEYIKGPTYNLRIDTRIVKTYTQDITVGSEIKFKVVANPLN